MDIRDFVKEGMTRVRNGTLNATRNLTQKQLLWSPAREANHIGFLLWHIARAEDALVNRWACGGTEVWLTGGWDKKIRLPSDKSVYEWTPELVADFKPALPDLLAYAAAEREAALASISKLDLARLGDHPRPDRPEWSVANILQIAISHEAHHQGAIEYLVGLMKAKGI